MTERLPHDMARDDGTSARSVSLSEPICSGSDHDRGYVGKDEEQYPGSPA
jgi:hypothetical protein